VVRAKQKEKRKIQEKKKTYVLTAFPSLSSNFRNFPPFFSNRSDKRRDPCTGQLGKKATQPPPYTGSPV
jgi:hypothetical protein